MPDTASLARISNDVIYAAIAFYALAFIAYAAAQAQSRMPTRRAVPVAAGAWPGAEASPPSELAEHRGPSLVASAAAALTVIAFGCHALGVLTRGLAATRVPWGNMYEFATTGALAVAATYLVVLSRRPVQALGLYIVGIVLLALGLAITTLYVPAAPLVPVLDSYWLVIHVAAAIVSGGLFTVGAVATGVSLVRGRRPRTSSVGASSAEQASRSRDAAALDQLSHTIHLFALPIWTFAVIAGAIWAENSWGRYWGWDPKETWAFITWVLYAAYLHAQSTAGWRGQKAAWLAVAGYGAFLFNFFGVNLWIAGLHSYAGV